ncbi:MAG: hypothetical protein ACLS61_14275 [Ruminococcus sp.]
MVGYVNGRDWNESSESLFCVFKFATRCESLNMFIEGRIGTRAGSEHYGQYDKKNCMTWNWKNWDGAGWQDEKLLSEVRKLLEKNKVSIQVEDKTGREGVDLAFCNC